MRNVEKMLLEALKEPAEVGPLLRSLVIGRYTGDEAKRQEGSLWYVANKASTNMKWIYCLGTCDESVEFYLLQKCKCVYLRRQEEFQYRVTELSPLNKGMKFHGLVILFIPNYIVAVFRIYISKL